MYPTPFFFSPIPSTMFLVGPRKQFKKMLHPSRLVSFCIFAAAMVGTLIAAFTVQEKLRPKTCLTFFFPDQKHSLNYRPLYRTVACIYLVFLEFCSFRSEVRKG